MLMWSMFKKTIIRETEQAEYANINVFREGVMGFADENEWRDKEEIEKDEIDACIAQALEPFREAVCQSVKNRMLSAQAKSQYEDAELWPNLAGLPEYNPLLLGVSPGACLAFMHIAIYGKPMNIRREASTMAAMNQAQLMLIKNEVSKLESEGIIPSWYTIEGEILEDILE